MANDPNKDKKSVEYAPSDTQPPTPRPKETKDPVEKELRWDREDVK